MAEWLGTGLQNRLLQFESGRDLRANSSDSQKSLFLYHCNFMKARRLFYILLALWVAADMLQAAFTPVHADEAYYALYGRFLDWGYYDHPPMVALLTAFSSLLFEGALSIRLATVLLHGATVWLAWKVLDDGLPTVGKVFAFFAVAASLPMFTIYGFITTPDAPLLFFTALFFFLYRKFLSNPGWPLAAAIGATAAAMLYSKYIAVIIIAFVLLSNVKLLKDRRVWMAMLITAVLFLPHVMWQINNDFPSLQYHLISRNSPFRPKYLLEYIPNQLLVFNPVCLCLSAYLCFRNIGTEDKFVRSCVFSVAGTMLFFWLMTFKGHSEPHWTVAASIPMIFILFNWLKDTEKKKWLRYAFAPVVALLLVARFLVPHIVAGKTDVFLNKAVFDEIDTFSGGADVVFTGSFQNPSLYWFHTGKESSSLSSVYGRRTQFDLWQFDKKVQGKPACIVENSTYRHHPAEEPNVLSANGKLSFLKVSNFQSASRIEATIKNHIIKGDTIFLDISFHNPYSLPFRFDHPEMPVTVLVAYFLENECRTLFCNIPDNGIVIPPGGSVDISTFAEFIPDCPLAISIDNVVCRSLNSRPLKIEKQIQI